MKGMRHFSLNEYYSGIFMDNPEFDELRASYAIAKNSIKSEDRMNKMSTFFSGLHGHVLPIAPAKILPILITGRLMNKLAMYQPVI